MITQRFNSNPKWRIPGISVNNQLQGLYELAFSVATRLDRSFVNEEIRMLEVGSYMGESTKVFASTGVFDRVVAVDPHEGYEEFNELFGYDWEIVKNEFYLNTKNFKCIELIQDYSYNIINTIPNQEFHFIYIDADHSYESVKKDIIMMLEKVKDGGFIGGHDYNEEHPGVVQAVREIFGNNVIERFCDESWLYRKI
jgi:hypothetical protein